MAEKQTFVIVGANTAGGKAAEALRGEGFDGRVVLIGAEPDRPYERPPLSKEYLRGEEERDRVFLKPDGFYRENDIDLRLGVRATGLDLRERAVELDGGGRTAFDRLLIATGGRVRRLPIPGADPSTELRAGLDGVYYLRTLADSERIAAELREGRRAVVIGAGFIGAEVAASARMKGLEVTVLGRAQVPLERALGPEVGRIYADIHREHGIDLRLGTSAERLEGSGRVERVVTSGGDAIDCDFVVVGVGIDPNTELAEGAGIEVDDGVIVDQYCETSAEGVFAAGDVARFHSPVLDERIRVEHWDNAAKQGPAAAKNMLGRREPYAEVPWFWSDQYDLNMQYVGYASSWDEVVFRGDPVERRFAAFYLKGGRLRAGLGISRPKEIRGAREIIRQGTPVTPEQLRDEGLDLRKLPGG